MKPIIKNMLVNGPNFFLFSGFVLAFVMNQKIGYTYIGASIISHIINYGLKVLIKQKRPDGAKDCHDYVTCDVKANGYGMPSGHAQSMALTLSFWLLYIWNNKQIKNKRVKIIGSIFITVSCVSVIYSRILFGCHSTLQTITGTIIGLLLGIIFFRTSYRN